MGLDSTEALRASEKRFRTLVQFSFDVYWESDAQHRFIRQEFAESLADAPAPGSELGKTRWEVPYLEPDEEAWRRHRATLDAHLPFRDFELARLTPDGGKRYVSVSGLPIFDDTGRFIGYRGVGRHITERKHAEEALRRSEAYLAESQRLTHTGSWAYDPVTKKAIYWSEERFRIFGLDPRRGSPPDNEEFLRVVHPEDRERMFERTREASRDKVDYALDYRIVLPDGTLKHLHEIGHPVLDKAGEVVEWIGTEVDVTERKRAEEELRESERRYREVQMELAHANRVATMGQLTASIAHEVNQPIAAVRNNAASALRFLSKNPPDLEEVREALKRVVTDTDRAG
jgi:PAS domain S-box-containing protein